MPVVAEKMDSRTYGYFDEHAIHINTKMWDDISETVDTIAHEGRHAYQHYAIKHPMFHSNVEEVASWRNNNIPGNYLSAEKYGQARYKAQPIEADAWTYASAIRLRLYPLGGD